MQSGDGLTLTTRYPSAPYPCATAAGMKVAEHRYPAWTPAWAGAAHQPANAAARASHLIVFMCGAPHSPEHLGCERGATTSRHVTEAPAAVRRAVRPARPAGGRPRASRGFAQPARAAPYLRRRR